MNVKTKNFIDGLNKNLNRLYTLNFACLKACARANQSNTVENAQFSGSTWLDDKVSILADQRSRWIASMQSSLLTLETSGFNTAMEQFKTDFMQTFEMVYGPSGSFDENFDGFEIKHPKFKEDFFDLDVLNTISNNHHRYQLLCYNYLSYLESYKQMLSYKAYQDIFATLSNDLKDNGYKTIYFEKPEKDIVLVDETAIQTQLAEAINLKKRAEVARKTALKKKDKTYSKVNDPRADETIKKAYSHFVACFEHEDNQHTFVAEYHYLAKNLAERMKSANTPSNTTLKNTLYEGFYDLMAGVNIFDNKNNYHTDKVYVHKLELEYLKYLKSKIELLKQYEVKKDETQPTQKQ